MVTRLKQQCESIIAELSITGWILTALGSQNIIKSALSITLSRTKDFHSFVVPHWGIGLVIYEHSISFLFFFEKVDTFIQRIEDTSRFSLDFN